MTLIASIGMLCFTCFTLIDCFGLLCLPCTQFLWIAFCRYPIFEVLYPKLQTRRLLNNAQVYSALSDEMSNISVMRLKPGGNKERIECDLVEGPIFQMEFEALSYVWGVTLLPYTISVNGKPFLITYNLYNALKELRHADRERLLWVDAVCINQHDKTEKGTQVHMMRDIYAGASRVIVWLGKSTRYTGSMFEFVQDFGTADANKIAAVWKDHTTRPMWKKMREEYIRVLEHEWWGRTWIIQELVLGRHVVMQCGRFRVDWEAVHKLFTYGPFGNDEFGNYYSPLFAKDIQTLREELRSAEDSSTTLGDLVIQFRLQSAPFGRDKIYALLGLLNPENPSLIAPDYRLSSNGVFLEFTRSCLCHMKNLNILSLASGTSLPNVSWCRDWRLNHDGLSKTCGLSSLEPPRPFSASGCHEPVFEIDLKHRILSIQGYMADTVEKVCFFQAGDVYIRMGMENIDWRSFFLFWEICAGRNRDDPEMTEATESFNRTVTADCWHTEPLDWRKRITARQKDIRNDEDAKYRIAVEDACVNRRFFVKKEGRFGLGPSNMKRGDVVSILSGGKTPFILRRCTSKKPDGYHRLIGEAFVDGLMYHDGSLRKDDTNRFHLR